MTTSLYVIQLVVISAVLFVVFRDEQRVMRLQLLAWLVLTTLIRIRYGLVEQANFYSNDQRYYVSVVEAIVFDGVPLDVDWWLSASRIPYTMPAALLTLTGIAPILALKTVSLIYLLLTTRLLLTKIQGLNLRGSLGAVYIMAVGGIGIFFSSLALRETSMMFFVAVVFTTSSLSSRLMALTMLTLLRPHLATAILIGYLIVFVLRRNKARNCKWSPIHAVYAMVLGPVIGYVLFSLDFNTKRA